MVGFRCITEKNIFMTDHLVLYQRCKMLLSFSQTRCDSIFSKFHNWIYDYLNLMHFPRLFLPCCCLQTFFPKCKTINLHVAIGDGECQGDWLRRRKNCLAIQLSDSENLLLWQQFQVTEKQLRSNWRLAIEVLFIVSHAVLRSINYQVVAMKSRNNAKCVIIAIIE